MRQGFLYLVAIIDWGTRRVLSWRIIETFARGCQPKHRRVCEDQDRSVGVTQGDVRAR
jgi:hypothetical protein